MNLHALLKQYQDKVVNDPDLDAFLVCVAIVAVVFGFLI
jgi:hypothetical protein